MKKSNLLFERLPFHKIGFLSFLLTFLFVAGMQLDMKAQNSSTLPNSLTGVPPQRVLYEVPKGNFVSVQTAIERLQNAIAGLKGQLAQFAEGTAPYDAALLRYTYFTEILTNLNNGRTVAESISISVGRITAVLPNPASPEVALVEKNAAISLLR